MFLRSELGSVKSVPTIGDGYEFVWWRFFPTLYSRLLLTQCLLGSTPQFFNRWSVQQMFGTIAT